MIAFKSRFWRVLMVPVFLSGLLSGAQSLPAASTVKLNGPLPAGGDVGNYTISPDGRYAVYLADQGTEGVKEIYSVSLGGGAPLRLNPPFSPGKNVMGFKISPDSSQVVYLADQETDEVFELYSVPIAGPASAGFKLNGPLVEIAGVVWGDVLSYQISPDSTRVVYRADQDDNTVDELYSVPLHGPVSQRVKLNEPLERNRDVEAFQISPDSSRVVYRADQDVYGVLELYSVALAGTGDRVKLNKTMPPTGNVGAFAISPGSNRVVYRADQDSDEVLELYSVPLNGPADYGVKLTEGGFSGDVLNFEISPDSSRVVYQALQGNVNLFSVHIVSPNSSRVKLNGPLIPEGDVFEFKISADGSRVVYLADQTTNGIGELYSVPLMGPAENGVKLNGMLGPDRQVMDFQISPDSSRVVYTLAHNYDPALELNSVLLKGTADSVVRLNGDLGTTGNIGGYAISPDSRWVVYRADQDSDEVFELYRTPAAGPAENGFKISGPLVLFGDVGSFLIGPDSRRVLYAADQDKDGVTELYLSGGYFIHLPLVLR